MSSNTGPVPGDVFDVKKVRKFIELMNEHDLAEIDLKQGDQRIRLRRPDAVKMAAMPAMPMSAAPSVVGGGGGERKAAEAAADESKFIVIKSPMVGTFYAAANPESPPFVKVGDRVGPETTVCIVEAMKVFNEIPAECSGRIAAVLVQSGDAVEFNQPLFRVEPN
jgi:acetyl-CoA carboxylase biotin carboxyl carrier protein